MPRALLAQTASSTNFLSLARHSAACASTLSADRLSPVCNRQRSAATARSTMQRVRVDFERSIVEPCVKATPDGHCTGYTPAMYWLYTGYVTAMYPLFAGYLPAMYRLCGSHTIRTCNMLLCSMLRLRGRGMLRRGAPGMNSSSRMRYSSWSPRTPSRNAVNA